MYRLYHFLCIQAIGMKVDSYMITVIPNVTFAPELY